MLYEIRVSYNTFNVKMIHEAIEFALSSCSQYTILGTIYKDDITYTLISSPTIATKTVSSYCYTKAPTYENRSFVPINNSVQISICDASSEDLHKYDLKGSK